MRATLHVIAVATIIVARICAAQMFAPDIPKAWADKDVTGFEVPLTHPDRSPRYMTEKEYYAVKVRPIYRSYPVYAEGSEPTGRDSRIKRARKKIGERREPVFSFLPRRHTLNQIFGKWRHRLSLPVSESNQRRK